MSQDSGSIPLPIVQETQPTQLPALIPVEAEPPQAGRIARAAVIIALGNVASRALGLVRETVKADLFGATGLVSAFEVAAVVPTIIYDLLIGGVISSALVPVFSEYAPKGRRDDLWFLVSSLVSLVLVVLTLFVLIVELFAPQVAQLLGSGLSDELLGETARLLRLTVPAVVFMSLSGVMTGVLYALKRFTLPALTAVIFNASIVLVALTMWQRWGIASLAVGLLVGAIFQVVLQTPGLRDARIRFNLNLHHPGLRRIGRLYIPVILSLIVGQLAVVLSYRLASYTGDQSISWMRYAATLIQFPLGLVATAVSVAILPTLSQQAVGGREHAADEKPNAKLEPFRVTLVQGLKLVLILIIPATAGLFVLAKPVVALVFEHGGFTPIDTHFTTQALRFALLGLIFAAVDQPFIFAFYARQDTWTPALVGMAGVFVYLLVALLPTLFGPLTLNGLILANSIQLAFHALAMLWLLQRDLNGLRNRGLSRLTLKASGASLVMGGVTWFIAKMLDQALMPGGLLAELSVILGAATVGFAVYVILMALLKADSGELLRDLLHRRRETRPE